MIAYCFVGISPKASNIYRKRMKVKIKDTPDPHVSYVFVEVTRTAEDLSCPDTGELLVARG